MNNAASDHPSRAAWGWRIVALLSVTTLLGLWWWLTPDEAAWLALVKAQLADLQTWHDASPWQVRTAFFLVYLLLATFAVPGIAVLTVAAGAVLGLAWGVLLVSFASTMGATLSFWLARYLLADLLRQLGEARYVRSVYTFSESEAVAETSRRAGAMPC